MRLISFALTTEQVRQKTKTVTRRLGWKFLKPGELLQACEKVMGRRKGEPLVRLGDIEVYSVMREPLNYLLTLSADEAKREVEREGFPNMTPQEFVAFFCKEMKCEPDTIITRIQFRYLPVYQ